MSNETTLTLYIPDLLSLQSALSLLAKNEMPAFPVLEKWLSRGLWEKSSTQADVIFSEFDLATDKNNEQPFAAFTLLAEDKAGLNPESETASYPYWIRADPIHIQPDRDSAILVAHEELALSQQEARSLVNEINVHFSDEPWKLYALHPHRWYLRHDQSQDLITHPLSRVLGQRLNHYLPTGSDADYWSQCINEIQMLLHASRTNLERETSGLPLVNGLWLWGGGEFPQSHPAHLFYTLIIADNVLLRGIAQYFDIEILALGKKYQDKLESGNAFVLLDMLSEPVNRRDMYSYINQLQMIEKDFLTELDSHLRNGKIDKIKLITGSATSVIITSKHLRHWWRRIKPLTDIHHA